LLVLVLFYEVKLLVCLTSYVHRKILRTANRSTVIFLND